jgi:hypothetical protein
MLSLMRNSWNIIDFLDPEIALLTFALNKTIKTEHKKIEYEADLPKPPQFCLPHNITRTRGIDTINGIELNCDGTELAKHSVSSTYQKVRLKNLGELCSTWQDIIKDAGVNHVKFYCDQNNYIIIELTEDKEFSLKYIIEQNKDGEFKYLFTYFGHLVKEKTTETTEHVIKVVNDWFGFRQEKFYKKGKYYSIKPVKV